VPNCDLSNSGVNGECAAMDSKTLGQGVFNRTMDPGYVTGWGTRAYNWWLGLAVQQEVMPRVSVNIGYFRNWWGNWYVVDNRATNPSDYTPFSITAPVDSRLGNNSGQVVSGLYNLVLDKVGPVDELAQSSENFGKQLENWQGVDINVVARLRQGLTVQAGTSTGRRIVDACEVRAKLPELGTGPTGLANSSLTANVTAGAAAGRALSVTNPYCRIEETYKTQFKGLATYTIPKVDVQVSGTWASIPGDDLAANFVADNAWIAKGPQPLGRNLSGASNVTVNLITPQTLFAPRRNNIDFRVAKILRFGRTRTQVGVDIYNLTNTDVATTFNQAYSPASTAWLTPTAIQPARYARIGAQIDF
jgi:hypothetical protein